VRRLNHDMYEHRTDPLLSHAAYRRRLLRQAGYAAALIGGSMIIGTAGFHFLAEQTVIDSVLNSAMLLGGMGPVGTIETTPGKLFASVFALYAGLVFLAAGAILLAPPVHRFLHRFHLDEAQRRRHDSG
jgi:hypothetical protein